MPATTTAPATATTLKIGPLTRVEGHLDIEATVDQVGGELRVVDAKSSGTTFRGFEAILQGRDPRDATILTQRICGVCPTSHAMASALALEAAFPVTPPNNGRILRNLILGADFLQSHLLHFYHLAAPDYIDTRGLLDMSPWMPRYVTPDMVSGSTAEQLVAHYVQALALRRKAHQMGAIFGGKLPCTPTIVPGGCTEVVTAAKISAFTLLLNELSAFINGQYQGDVYAVAQAFPEYADIGQGCGNLLAYGVFDLNAAGTSKHLPRGRYTNGALATVSPGQIIEYVDSSSYAASSGGVNPSSGSTTPRVGKVGAYSWIKAPRYQHLVHEVGPLARMWVAGLYQEGISVIDRIAARFKEAQHIASGMAAWLGQLVVGQPSYRYSPIPASASGIGLTEAPRGALGHWVRIGGSKLSRYQVVAATTWNASPMDDQRHKGPIEQALIGTPVADPAQPIELLRVVHSFDPCLACAVHVARPGEKARKFLVSA